MGRPDPGWPARLCTMRLLWLLFRGGPAEIIEDGVSGFQIDPYHGEDAAETMADFFERCASDGSYWDTISQGIRLVHASELFLA